MQTLIYSLKFIMTCLYISYNNSKILNKNIKNGLIKMSFLYVIFSIGYTYLSDVLHIEGNNTIFSTLCVSIVYMLVNRVEYLHSLIITFCSMAINQIAFFISSAITYFLIKSISFDNEYVTFLIISIIQITILILFWKIKRLNKGITFLKKWKDDEYINLLLLNLCSEILLIAIIISNYQENTTSKYGVIFIIIAIIMFITIWKSIKLYYKKQMMEKQLAETERKLTDKENEAKKLEEENLHFSEISHSIAHRQKALNYELEKLKMKTEISDELSIETQLNEINNELARKPNIKLDKTGIDKIDNMLEYLQSECIKNKIEFQLQINGNIFYMTNHYVTVDDLEILLADHIKDAIIAIKHTDTENKNILVKLGKINDIYGIYIYDSGIEFENETLNNLGKRPITTHKEEGGTGFGFMNTFQTLKKYKGSLEIEEIGKISNDNFTKIIKIIFDGKNNFNINSYRKYKINKLM